jgi:hypothetical protein
MKSLAKFWFLGFLVMLMTTSGCMTWVAKPEDMSGVYDKPAIIGVPTIIITNLSDKRNDTTLVGRISALNLATETPVNVIITNRIASKLRDAGFNIQKVELAGFESKSDRIAVLKRKGGKMLFTGSLNAFFIASNDAILESAKGRVSFSVDILDNRGNSLFYGRYTARTEKHLGLDGGPGSERLIEETIQATVNKLLNDTQFQQFLLKVR